ncbi:hypothetical protein YC2023_027253 [Brassica napus]
MIVILGGAFFALGNINPPAEANIQHPLNLLINLLSMKECRFHSQGSSRCLVSCLELISLTSLPNLNRQVRKTPPTLSPLNMPDA